MLAKVGVVWLGRLWLSDLAVDMSGGRHAWVGNIFLVFRDNVAEMLEVHSDSRQLFLTGHGDWSRLSCIK